MRSTNGAGTAGLAAGAVLSALLAGGAEGSVIWDGDASRGTGVFKAIGNGNCASPSTLTAVTDSTHGRVWRYHKPSSTNRCENHGVKVGGQSYTFRNGSTYYLGWRSKLNTTANNNANFQWKSYGNGHVQNFPVVLKMINGKMTLMQRQPGGQETFLWSRTISANTWYRYVLGIRLSNQTRGGWIELWFNGTKQTFTTGSQRYACRTFDSGNHNCPKWGVYGGSGTTMINYIDALKVGTTYRDVAP